MRVKKIASALMAIILLMSIAGCSSPKKESAKQVKSESKERVVATTVAVTEIMDALEVDLVGVPTSSKTLPKRYKGLPEVGNPMSPDMEKVKSLKPSEVLSVTTLEYELKPVFDGVGMKANFLDLTSLKNMQSSISDLGKKYGREKQAEAVVTKLDKKVASIQKEVKGKKEPTVLILLGVPGSYLVATEHSYIGDLVKQLGGKNIVQGEQVEYLASNTEYLKKADPDIILRAAHGMPDEVVKMFDKEFKTNDIWKHFAAVKNNRVYDLEERLFGTTGNLAAIEALDELKKMMYP
ncbi:MULTISPECIES: heme ABC transporter substrate-binding protein IsdE [Bacillus cereus group]|uniref:High-affinity heme uptake system protein IsdE n=1 Tax=Bacillus thuringiensis subsp. jegathesan TaxID=56955 RepID=A0A9X6R1J0_BACTJ|nr:MULTISPECIES: heme ABC transporter substrate-binding protein IsdE [Bacillus cereus group]MBG9534503.1 heme ABC transporter substrate-binding protein [Bacillus thuringiensis]MCC3689355.1 heme ABC transporter substrate-binding protein IsdE [Bacillus cereus]OUB71925.1 heme ABC transporter substrate-binding protein IsdE [Bacillus thuringiensis serovar jegathesan]HDR8448654.1 heme ABC transporter substrate-binding protein IsdE [Bacillus cereus]HDR8461198.1 heme ABC transporter substrate-binding 